MKLVSRRSFDKLVLVVIIAPIPRLESLTSDPLSKNSGESPFIPFTHYHSPNILVAPGIVPLPWVILPSPADPSPSFLKTPELLTGWGRLVFSILLLHVLRHHLKSKIGAIFIQKVFMRT